MPTYVALLRGINLGARNRVAMSDLRAALSGLGYDDVRTYLQSGNAVFRAPTTSAKAVRAEVEKGLADALGKDLTVLIRASAELAHVVQADPFGNRATDPARYYVYFADGPVASSTFADVRADAIAPEELAVVGREIYAWMPAGLHKAKVDGLVTARSRGLVLTARNWRTVQALHDLAGDPPR